MTDAPVLIDASARIDTSAVIGANVTIGPYSVIGPDVEIGDDCWIGPHAVINGPTRMGHGNKVFQFASIGEAPQDLTYHGEDTRLEIGDGNTFRENCTVNRGTIKGGGVTRIGDHNLLMACTHVAHDCELRNNTILANGASLGGHVLVEDHAMLAGFALVHQFVRVGAHAFCAMGSGLSKDVPPFVMVSGNPAHPHGINKVGLERRGFTSDDLRAIRRAYKAMYKTGLKLGEAVALLRADDNPHVRDMAAFIENSSRSIVR